MTDSDAIACHHSRIAAATNDAYAINGRPAYQIQSSASGLYLLFCACRMILIAYAMPATPPPARQNPILGSACHGALVTAETSSAAQKWTMVGVPKARISSMLLSTCTSAIRIMTTT